MTEGRTWILVPDLGDSAQRKMFERLGADGFRLYVDLKALLHECSYDFGFGIHQVGQNYQFTFTASETPERVAGYLGSDPGKLAALLNYCAAENLAKVEPGRFTLFETKKTMHGSTSMERQAAKVKRRRRSQHVAGRGKTPPKTCRYDYHGGLWESTSKLIRYADDMTGGGTTKSGRYFFGSHRSTARILKMSTDTFGRALEQALSEGIFRIPGDHKDEWSKFGSKNYVVVTHDEWVEENGDSQCEGCSDDALRCSDDRHTQDS
jgi:hypothetical protein